METKTIVIIIIGIVVLLAAFPFVPKFLDALKDPDPPMDAENLERIQAAVRAHNEAKGYPPSSLAALVPDYLDAVPATDDGKAFTYNRQTSVVGLPVKTPSHGPRILGQRPHAYGRCLYGAFRTERTELLIAERRLRRRSRRITRGISSR